MFERALREFEDLRRAGAASLDLAWTAAGVFDGYFEQNLGTWDVAAGALIVREAGGVVTDWQGDERAWLASGDIVAGPPAVHERILEIIATAPRRLRRERDRSFGSDAAAEARRAVAERGVDRVGDVDVAALGGDRVGQPVADHDHHETAVGIGEPARRRHPAVPERAAPGAAGEVDGHAEPERRRANRTPRR